MFLGKTESYKPKVPLLAALSQEQCPAGITSSPIPSS